MDKNFLFELLNTDSVSGNEAKIEKKIYDKAKEFADEVSADELGNVTSAVNTASPFKVMICAHTDEIGLMVTKIEDDGMLRVTGVGGIYPTCFPGHKVRISAKYGTIYGVCVNTRELAKKGGVDTHDLYIDIGAKDRDEASRLVSVGDCVTSDTSVRELAGSRITSRAIDDKAGAYVVLKALKTALEEGISVGAYAVTTTGEETTMNGAYFSASRIKPNIAIVVDVTYATDYPGADCAETGLVRLGKGPVLCVSPSVSKKVNEMLRSSAEKAGIRIQTEVAGSRTYTDGDTVHKTGVGVPFALVSIPIRYMHTPSETADIDDIENSARLIAEFLSSIDEDTDLRPF